MSMLTVVTDNGGQILAVGQGPLSETQSKRSKSNGAAAGIRALPGQKLHEIEAPIDLAAHKNFKEIEEKVRQHLNLRKA